MGVEGGVVVGNTVIIIGVEDSNSHNTAEEEWDNSPGSDRSRRGHKKKEMRALLTPFIIVSIQLTTRETDRSKKRKESKADDDDS